MQILKDSVQHLCTKACSFKTVLQKENDKIWPLSSNSSFCFAKIFPRFIYLRSFKGTCGCLFSCDLIFLLFLCSAFMRKSLKIHMSKIVSFQSSHYHSEKKQRLWFFSHLYQCTSGVAKSKPMLFWKCESRMVKIKPLFCVYKLELVSLRYFWYVYLLMLSLI